MGSSGFSRYVAMRNTASDLVYAFFSSCDVVTPTCEHKRLR